ncbi:hypothetical protein PUN28_020816 [Cardiocondyla obscurior]|uniref:Uncharacterized protein n=1 Tax=Cardiocondyla obscurior TaxID=286306 RepID=A0AAW2E5F1_9HYME
MRASPAETRGFITSEKRRTSILFGRTGDTRDASAARRAWFAADRVKMYMFVTVHPAMHRSGHNNGRPPDTTPSGGDPGRGAPQTLYFNTRRNSTATHSRSAAKSIRGLSRASPSAAEPRRRRRGPSFPSAPHPGASAPRVGTRHVPR